MVEFNPSISSSFSNKIGGVGGASKAVGNGQDFGKTVKEYVSKANDLQQDSENSIKDLLTGKNQDINSVVASVAKADASFKLLVGVRNKIIEAYKETMKMQI